MLKEILKFWWNYN